MITYNVAETGKRIRELRTKAGYTQAELARLVGVHDQYFYFAEAGKKSCSIDVLVSLREIFDSDMEYLILGETIKPKTRKERIADAISLLEEMKETAE